MRGVDEGEGLAEVVVEERIDAAVVAKILTLVFGKTLSTRAHLSQNGTASSRSFPMPERDFFVTTGKGRVA